MDDTTEDHTNDGSKTINRSIRKYKNSLKTQDLDFDGIDKNSLTDSNDLKLPKIHRRHIKFA